ncbi:hypothetical protein T439DRAFT_377326 [Meredithblackwellia eburnea MCA 4105]
MADLGTEKQANFYVSIDSKSSKSSSANSPSSSSFSAGNHRDASSVMTSAITSEHASTSSGRESPTDLDGDTIMKSAQEEEEVDELEADDEALQPDRKRTRLSKQETIYCHQDHQPHPASTTVALTCTAVKHRQSSSSSSKPAATTCRKVYCGRCLQARYGESAEGIIETDLHKSWECPACRGICNCSVCRRKSNQPATGSLAKIAKSQGLESAADVLKIDPSTTSINKKASSTGPLSASSAGNSSKSARHNVSGQNGASSSTATSRAHEPKPSENDTLSSADESSDLSSLSSDEEETTTTVPARGKKAVPSVGAANGTKGKSKAKGKVTAAPAPAAGKNKRKANELVANGKKGKGTTATSATSAPDPLPKVKSKPAPRVAPPPKAMRILLSPLIPTTAVEARLHVRDFFLRFQNLMPCLSFESSGSGSHYNSIKTARSIVSALEQPESFWSGAGDVNQRGLLEGLVELLLKDMRGCSLTNDATERRDWLEEVSAQLAATKRSANAEVAAKPWATTWEELDKMEKHVWGDLSEEWILMREKADEESEKKRRAFKWEVSTERRLASICSLIDIASESNIIRKDLTDGIETERLGKFELSKQRAKLRADLNDAKAKVWASKPVEPEASPSKKAAVKAKYKDEMAKITAEVKRLEKESEVEVRRINYDSHLLSMAHRIRFIPAGTDPEGNDYYFLLPSPGSPYPTDTVVENLPLSWTIVIHGRGFPSLEASEEEFPRSADDEWLSIGDIDEMYKLVDFLEYGPKKAKYDNEIALAKAEEEKNAKGKGKKKQQEPEEAKLVEVVDVGELTAQLRGFADYCRHARAKAFEGGSGRTRDRAAKRSL